MKLTKMIVSFTLIFALMAVPVGAFWFPSWDDVGGTEVMVYMGELGADTYELSLNGVLFTEEQIGFMADRILWTEGEIGLMADRIVYVTEMSQDNSTEIIYQVVDGSWQWQDGFWNAYSVTLEEVTSLPSGWE